MSASPRELIVQSCHQGRVWKRSWIGFSVEYFEQKYKERRSICTFKKCEKDQHVTNNQTHKDKLLKLCFSSCRFGSKTDARSGGDRNALHQRNQRTLRNGTNPAKRPRRKPRRVRARWSRTADRRDEPCCPVAQLYISLHLILYMFRYLYLI